MFKDFTDNEVKMSFTLIQRLSYEYSRDKHITELLTQIYRDLLAKRSSRKIYESAEHITIDGNIQKSLYKRQEPLSRQKDTPPPVEIKIKPLFRPRFKTT